MKPQSLLAILAGTLALVVIGRFLMVEAPVSPPPGGARGVRVPPLGRRPEPRTFDPSQSAALFIGVRTFTRDQNIVEVPYAADDAVDLAYEFALNSRIALVSPPRVVIALSGRPQKEESKWRLHELEQAGASVEKAEPSDILLLMQRQAARAGKDGMLIVSIATHGFAKDGVPYILGSTSLFQFPETGLPMPKLFDIAAISDAPRSLFFVDACRERITSKSRGGASTDTAAPFISRMKRVKGQVIFYAAAGGGYAYDDDGNGVFTKEVIEGLHCKAAFARGAVTVQTLHAFVERNVLKWIRQNRNPGIATATQVSMDGDSKNMPLCMCAGPPPPPPPGDVARAIREGSNVTAFTADGARLWSHEIGRISQVEVADLDNDGSHEVLIGAESSLQVFNRAGMNVWSAGQQKMSLHAFVVDHLLRHDPTLQIATLWNDDDDRSVIATYNASGQCMSTYAHHGRLQQVVIDRPTSRHNRKIIASGTDDEAGTLLAIHKPMAALVMLDNYGKLIWKGVVMPSAERVIKVAVTNHDKYSREIALFTTTGDEIHIDFDGNVLALSSPRVKLEVLPHNRRHPSSP